MRRLVYLGLTTSIALAGCARAPSVVVFGASFPDWLFCITAGVIATALVHLARAGGRRLACLDPVGVAYPILATLFSLLAWLIFFLR